MMKIASFRITPVRNGFSLLEMLVVVSIILILATVAVPKFMSAGKTAKIAKISADIRIKGNIPKRCPLWLQRIQTVRHICNSSPSFLTELYTA